MPCYDYRGLSSKNEKKYIYIKIEIDSLILNQSSFSKALMRKSIYCEQESIHFENEWKSVNFKQVGYN